MHFGIIAAGEGSRLAEEGIALPKPLVEIGGRPMIGRLIEIMTQCGAEGIEVIVNSRMTAVADYVEELSRQSPIEIGVLNASTPSSMHSFYELSKRLRRVDKFILTTVDTIFNSDRFGEYVEAFSNSSGIDALMGITEYIDDEKPLYVNVDSEMRIESFLDSPAESCGIAGYVSAGVYGLTQRAVEVLDGCMARGISRMRNYQRALLEEGLKVKGYNLGKVFDIDHARDLAKAREMIKKQE